MGSVLINVPKKASRGQVIEIKTLMSHIMETGFRHLATGELIPRDIITSFLLPLQWRRDFPRRSVPGDLREPFHRLLHHRNRERHVRIQLDRRPRIF